MQRKDLALRVLSTAAIMSIVTSIAAPAFAGTYYIGKGSIDVVTKKDTSFASAWRASRGVVPAFCTNSAQVFSPFYPPPLYLFQ